MCGRCKKIQNVVSMFCLNYYTYLVRLEDMCRIELNNFCLEIQGFLQNKLHYLDAYMKRNHSTTYKQHRVRSSRLAHVACVLYTRVCICNMHNPLLFIVCRLFPSRLSLGMQWHLPQDSPSTRAQSTERHCCFT